MRYIFFAIILVCSSCSITIESRKKALPNEAVQTLDQLASGTLVVRVPTQGKKIAFLKEAMARTSDQKKRGQYAALVKQAIQEDQTQFQTISTSFERHYSFSKYAFVPDSLYKNFLRGERNVFIKTDTDKVFTDTIPGEFFVWLTLEHKNQFGLFAKEGVRLPDPLPWRKNTFLAGFKRWLTPEKYIDSQVRWLQQKLTSIR